MDTRFIIPSAITLLIVMMLGLALCPAQASVFTINMTQQGSDLDLAGSGSIDLTGLSLALPDDPRDVQLTPGLSICGIGAAYFTGDGYFGPISGPSSFGTGGLGGFALPSSGTGTPFRISPETGPEPEIDVLQGYASGSAFAGTSVYSNTTFASLGITPGRYTWAWNNGANSVVLNTPEPMSVCLVLLSGIGLLGHRRR